MQLRRVAVRHVEAAACGAFGFARRLKLSPRSSAVVLVRAGPRANRWKMSGPWLARWPASWCPPLVGVRVVGARG